MTLYNMVDVPCSCLQPHQVSIHFPFLEAPWISFPWISAMCCGWFTSHSTTRMPQAKKLNSTIVNDKMFLELLENTCSLNLPLTLDEGSEDLRVELQGVLYGVWGQNQHWGRQSTDEPLLTLRAALSRRSQSKSTASLSCLSHFKLGFVRSTS